MAERSCTDVSRDLSAWLGGDLGVIGRLRLGLHLAGCARCRKERRQLVTARALIRAHGQKAADGTMDVALLHRFQQAAVAYQTAQAKRSVTERTVDTLAFLLGGTRARLAAITVMTASAVLIFVGPGSHMEHAAGGVGCAGPVLVGGFLPLALMGLLTRDLRRRLSAASIATVGGVGAVLGQIMTQTHCPGGNVGPHLLLFHFGVVAAFILTTWGGASLMQRPQVSTS